MRFMTVVLMGISICAAACSKKDEGTATAPSAPSAAPASGCGADYADPKKEFCMKLPEGFKAEADPSPGDLYVEIMKFDSPMEHFSVSIGFSSSNYKTYAEQLASDEKWMGESKNIKIESSGKTAAGGKWWQFDNQGYSSFSSVTKSNGDKTIRCETNDRKPGIIEACQSIRAYPM